MIECNVTPNTSVIVSKNRKSSHIESGCNITFNQYDKEFVEKLWPELKRRFNLECAHINFTYDGCIKKL